MPRLKGQSRIDEFAFVLLAGVILIIVLAVAWGTLQNNPVGVSPARETLTIASGDSKTFNLELNGSTINTTLQASGSIMGWISFDQNQFDLQGSRQIIVTVAVPPALPQGIYDGTINVVSGTNIEQVQVEVNVSSVTVNNAVRNIRFGEFPVSYEVGSQTVSERDNFQISKGYFSDYPGTVVATMTQSTYSITTGGAIVIDIADTNGVGNLIVDLNGNEIYNQPASSGEITIPLDRAQISKSNNLVLRAGNPGFNFWMNTVFEIKSASFDVDVQGEQRQDATFQLTSDEVSNFQFGKISANINKYNPSALNPLTIAINNATIMDDVPTLFTFSRTFGSEVPLNAGTNTISFYVSKEAYYDLSDVTLTLVSKA